jgi:L-ascorbate metabolism protein UlaG (beta-lactamase superfamily)
MHITYHGLSCFKITAKTEGRGSNDIIIVFAPYDNKKFGIRPPQGNADVVIVPHPDPMFSNAQVLRGEPIVLDRPGEFAVKSINIIGIDAPADPRDGQDRGNSVIFTLDIENMKVAYLGAIGMDLTPDALDVVAGADIVFLPVGDEAGLDGKTAETIARKIEPKLIIPMQYKTKGLKTKDIRDEKDFCSEIGNCPKKKEEKLIIKAKDLENKTMDVILLDVV